MRRAGLTEASGLYFGDLLGYLGRPLGHFIFGLLATNSFQGL